MNRRPCPRPAVRCLCSWTPAPSSLLSLLLLFSLLAVLLAAAVVCAGSSLPFVVLSTLSGLSTRVQTLSGWNACLLMSHGLLLLHGQDVCVMSMIADGLADGPDGLELIDCGRLANPAASSISLPNATTTGDSTAAAYSHDCCRRRPSLLLTAARGPGDSTAASHGCCRLRPSLVLTAARGPGRTAWRTARAPTR